MAFKNILFPENISYGCTGGPEFNTDVIVVASGKEKRSSNWEEPLYRFEVSHGVKTQEQLDELIDFFYEVGGRADSFLYKNWMEYIITHNKSFVVQDKNDTTKFQMYKKYQVSEQTGKFKKIKNPIVNTINVYIDGVETTNFQYDGNGILTINTPGLTSNKIKFSCEFYLECRFDTDRMFSRIDNYNIYSWDQIPIKEVI